MNLSDYIMTSPEYKQVDIVRKCQKYPQFRKQLIKIQKQYQHKLNMSLYLNLQQIEKLDAIHIYNYVDENQKNKQKKQKKQKHNNNDKNYQKIYVNIYGFKMQFQQLEDQNKFYFLFIRMLDEKLRSNQFQRYSIIYYHSLAQSINPFSFLNSTYKNLPIFYYAMLDKIYVVQPNFIVKNAIGIFDFGRLHKLYTKRIVYVDNLYELGKINQVSRSNVLNTLPNILKQQKLLKEEKKIIKNDALQNIQNKTQNKNNNNNNTYGVNNTISNQLITLKTQQPQDFMTIPLQNHKFTQQGLPISLMILLQSLKSKPQHLLLQGIFRKSGSIQQQQDIIKQLQQMSSILILKNINQYSGYAIAGVVKKFFTKLTIPIIPYEIYNQIMKVQSVEQGKQIQFVKNIVNKIPLLNKRILITLIVFLREHVIAKKQYNKMNNYNMSVCFCPCIFRAKQATLQDLMNSGKYAKILDILFTKFDEIFNKQENKVLNSPGKQNRGSKGSKGSRGSRGSVNLKENQENQKINNNNNNDDSPNKKII